MSRTFKREETVTIDTEVEGIDAPISEVTIKIDGENGSPILEETAITNMGNQEFRYFWNTIDFNPITWVVSTAYSVGDWVQPPTSNGKRYICTIAGNSYQAEPDEWIPEEDDTGITTLNEAPPYWETGKEYIIGDEIIPTDSTFEYNVKYVCSTAGTSGASEPGFDSEIGNPTTDGTVEWTATTWDYATWEVWSIQVEPQLYLVNLKVTDNNNHIGLEDFKIRIVE